MKADLEALNRATEAHSAAAPQLNRDFHIALVRPAGRRLTTQLVERLHGRSAGAVRQRPGHECGQR